MFANCKKLLIAALAVLAFASSAYAQGRGGVVKGTVVDATGEPLIGAAVIEKGTTNGTMTDVDGAFSITVRTSPVTLVVNCMSYIEKEVQATAGSTISVTLEDDSQTLEEVVIVGYGTQKKVNLTGAVTSINFDEKINSRPVTNVSSALNGLSAGVSVTQSSGKPGESATIRVRGIGTLNDAQPLVLVDGVEWDMDNVNPADIENISILKDASSTAIYGALGANGVILITTKRGNGEPKFAYNGYASLQHAINKLSYVIDYADHMEYANENAWQREAPQPYSEASIELWRNAKNDPNGYTGANAYPNYICYPNTDWFDVLFNPAFSYNHHLSMSGSSKNINYSFAFGYLDNPGVMNVIDGMDSGEKKITLQSRVEGKVGDWLSVGMNVQARRSNLGIASVENSFNSISGTVSGFWPAGQNMRFGTAANIAEEGTSANNLLEKACGSDGEKIVMDANLSAFFTANIMKGLTLEGKYNYQLFNQDTRNWTVKVEKFNFNQNSLLETTNLDSATISASNSRSERTNAELLLRYNEQFGDFNVGALAGFSSQEYQYHTFSTSRKGMTSWELHEISTASTLNSAGSSSTNWAMESFFGRVNVNYKERYLAEFNARYDGSSRFSPQARWGFFPSASAGWRINKEEFMEDTAGWLSNLKLRASWGKVGNCRTNDYAWQATYRIAKVIVDGSPSTVLSVGKIGNEELEWETTTSTDLGLDLGFFKDKLTAEFDFYDKNTTGILFTPEMYLTMGSREGSTQNIASVNNKGLEFTLKWSDTIGDFFYSVGGNLSFNRDMVTKNKGKPTKEWQLRYDETGAPIIDEETGEQARTYYSNIGEVSIGGFGGQICEGHKLGETYFFKLYHGNGKGYTGGEVDPNAGPVDGMIRTESDYDWVQAMLDAGYTFCGCKKLLRNSFWYGDYLYEDANGDGQYGDTNDQNFTGHSYTPSTNFAVNISLGWKGFDFYTLISGSAGFWLLDIAYAAPAVSRPVYKYMAEDHYFYDPENPGDPRTNLKATYPRFGSTSSAASDAWEYKGDYIKVKNVQLGYTIPQRITERINIDKLRFYVSGDNLFTFTKYPGMDPELGTSVTYPLLKQYAVGVQMTF
ncbi:MAG: TonB-dependent receptor [Bacteroidales bacterium]|nr:TonB-dependent receptor [Candidatus Cryptobacteroides aphodequi]